MASKQIGSGPIADAILAEFSGKLQLRRAINEEELAAVLRKVRWPQSEWKNCDDKGPWIEEARAAIGEFKKCANVMTATLPPTTCRKCGRPLTIHLKVIVEGEM